MATGDFLLGPSDVTQSVGINNPVNIGDGTNGTLTAYQKFPLSDGAATQTLTAKQSGILLTNSGKTSTMTYTLPTPAAGLQYEFINRASGYSLAVVAGSGYLLQNGTTASQLACTVAGATLRLRATDTTGFVASGTVGTWA